MDSYTILIILSSLVVFSYLLDMLARRSHIPSVLLLLLLGIILKSLTEYFGIRTIDFLDILPTLGTIGLILIVLEGALELRYHESKKQLINNAFFTALFLLLIIVFSLTGLFMYITEMPFYNCFLNAIPFSIISSAIAIPSVAGIQKESKEFVIYESSFSDILGIVLFDFALYNTSFKPATFLTLGLDMLLILVLSAIFCLFLLFVMGRIKHHVKFFLILAILVLMYALGKHYHLSSLVFVLAFGLFLSNADQVRNAWFRKNLLYRKLHRDLHRLYQFTAESAFLLRTYFFIIFGFTIAIETFLHRTVALNGLLIVILIFTTRYIYLKYIAKVNSGPVVYVSPRGLISILLFFSIPPELQMVEIGNGLLFIVILATGIVMAYGLFTYRKDPKAGTGAGS